MIFEPKVQMSPHFFDCIKDSFDAYLRWKFIIRYQIATKVFLRRVVYSQSLEYHLESAIGIAKEQQGKNRHAILAAGKFTALSEQICRLP